MRDWGTNGIDVGDMVRLDDGEFEHRISSSSWAKGRLRAGDVLVATRHSGDCFFDWLLVRASPDVLRDARTLHLEPVTAPIGAYTLGRAIGTMSPELLAALMSGGSVTIDMPGGYETPRRTHEEEVPFMTFGDLGGLIARMPKAMLDSKVTLADDSGVDGDGGTMYLDHASGRVMMVSTNA
jgi:hypothetical protein